MIGRSVPKMTKKKEKGNGKTMWFPKVRMSAEVSQNIPRTGC